jgi:hypothetical protein
MVTKEIYTPYGPIQGDHVMWWVIYQERKIHTSYGPVQGDHVMWWVMYLKKERRGLCGYPEWKKCLCGP